MNWLWSGRDEEHRILDAGYPYPHIGNLIELGCEVMVVPSSACLTTGGVTDTSGGFFICVGISCLAKLFSIWAQPPFVCGVGSDLFRFAVMVLVFLGLVVVWCMGDGCIRACVLSGEIV